jgi:hypothetical protein
MDTSKVELFSKCYIILQLTLLLLVITDLEWPVGFEEGIEFMYSMENWN